MNPSDPEIPNPIDEVEEPDDFKAMLTGAVLIFVVAFIPFASLSCCLPHVAAALLAVHLFTSKYALTLTAGRAMKLGIFTCLMGALAAWTVAMAIYFLFDYQVGAKDGEFIAMKFAEMSGDPNAIEKVREALEQQQASGLGVLQIAMSLLGSAAIAAVAGVIGGAIGAALFKRGPKELKQ